MSIHCKIFDSALSSTYTICPLFRSLGCAVICRNSTRSPCGVNSFTSTYLTLGGGGDLWLIRYVRILGFYHFGVYQMSLCILHGSLGNMYYMEGDKNN